MELNEIRKKYNLLIEKNEKIKKLQKKLNRLETKRIIIEYNQIKQVLSEESILTKEQIIDSVFEDDIINEVDSDIYIYSGAFIYNLGSDIGGDYICEDIENADYLLYKNIANPTDNKQIIPSDAKNFEKEHIIINFKGAYVNNYKYYDLRRLYLEKLLNGMYEKEIITFFQEYSMIFGIQNISIPKNNNIKKKILK